MRSIRPGSRAPQAPVSRCRPLPILVGGQIIYRHIRRLTHQHLGEIYESLNQLQETSLGKPMADGSLSFVPWRGDFTRGIFVSSTITCDLEISELNKLYEDFYAGHPFTHVSREAIFLKQVVNTNKAVVQLEKAGTKVGHSFHYRQLIEGSEWAGGSKHEPALRPG